jgi:DNA-directed RNA polymerase subunit H (RpoH/RPB5)
MNTDVLISMLKSRGINTDDAKNIESDFGNVTKYDNVLVISGRFRVSEKDLTNIVNLVEENGASTGIIIVQVPPSETIVNAVSNLSNKIQLFHTAQLSVDITKHRKVPSHRIMSGEEIEKMFEKFHISIPSITKKIQEDKIVLDVDLPFLQQLGMKHKEYMPLPYIWVQDAQARWIGAKPGDIIEIMRKSETSGSTPYYRFCVANVI